MSLLLSILKTKLFYPFLMIEFFEIGFQFINDAISQQTNCAKTINLCGDIQICF
jgi:hypothetical protein